jgi:hypothetical protein
LLIFQKHSKVNNHPFGENSPNLVTLNSSADLSNTHSHLGPVELGEQLPFFGGVDVDGADQVLLLLFHPEIQEDALHGFIGSCSIEIQSVEIKSVEIKSVKIIEILALEQVGWCCSSKHFGNKPLVKSLLISTLHRQGNLLQRNIFTGLNKPLFTTTQNRLETS